MILHHGEKAIYSFQQDISGQQLNIVSTDNGWVYHSGIALYTQRWINQLGEQVELRKEKALLMPNISTSI